MNKKIEYILLILFVVIMPLHAQRVSNVSVYQEGQTIAIEYDLSAKADVSISVSLNRGATYQKLFFVEGDIGRRIQAGRCKANWNVIKDLEVETFDKTVMFKVKAHPTYKTFILPYGSLIFPNYLISVSVLDWNVGLMIGGARYAGWYVKAQSSCTWFENSYIDGVISLHKYDIDHLHFEQGTIHNVLPFYSGSHKRASLLVAGGGIVRLGCPLHLYVGLGYGRYDTYWITTDGKYILKDGPSWERYSYRDMVLDMGLLVNFNCFAMSAGVTTIGWYWHYLEVNIGLGVAL